MAQFRPDEEVTWNWNRFVNYGMGGAGNVEPLATQNRNKGPVTPWKPPPMTPPIAGPPPGSWNPVIPPLPTLPPWLLPPGGPPNIWPTFPQPWQPWNPSNPWKPQMPWQPWMPVNPKMPVVVPSPGGSTRPPPRDPGEIIFYPYVGTSSGMPGPGQLPLDQIVKYPYQAALNETPGRPAAPELIPPPINGGMPGPDTGGSFIPPVGPTTPGLTGQPMMPQPGSPGAGFHTWPTERPTRIVRGILPGGALATFVPPGLPPPSGNRPGQIVYPITPPFGGPPAQQIIYLPGYPV